MRSFSPKACLLAFASSVATWFFVRYGQFAWAVPAGLASIGTLPFLFPAVHQTWRWKVSLVLVLSSLSVLVLLPTLARASRGRIPCPAVIKKHIHFGIAPGLDLRGGLRLVYTVEVDEAVRDKRDRLADELRFQLATQWGIHKGKGGLAREELFLLKQKVRVSTPESGVLRLLFSEEKERSVLDGLIEKKYQQELVQSRSTKPGEVILRLRPALETQIRDRAVEQAKDIVYRRIDQLGLRETNLSVRDEDIIIEVPGDNATVFNEIKEIIRQTARLEFKLVDDTTDLFASIAPTEFPQEEGITLSTETAPDGPNKSIRTHFAYLAKRENETMLQAKARLKKWISTLSIPDDHQVGFQKVTVYDEATFSSKEVGWRTYSLLTQAELTGESIVDASVVQEETRTGLGGSYSVGIAFDTAGAARFEQITEANVQRRFAILLDEVIDSTPVIQTKISGGKASISMGAASMDQQLENAKKLELVLRSGALPAPLTLSNESVIGPSLGRDAIAQAVKGMIGGSLLVLVFMAFYYHKAGVVADLAVLLNLVMQLAILALFGATMTLPGIAGLALTIGMSVDANVLINERIREELRLGRSPRAAVGAGYSRAFSSILDGHVTVFISGLILAQYGSGPVRGFAVNLLVGILTSLFTGVFCTRLVFDAWCAKKVKRLSVGGGF